MSYRSLGLAIAALSWMQPVNADAQSVYVAPGGVYIGAGPVYVTPAPNDAAYGYGPPAVGYGPPAVVSPPPVVAAPTGMHRAYGLYYDTPLSGYSAVPPPRPPAPVPYAAAPYYGSSHCYYGSHWQPCY